MNVIIDIKPGVTVKRKYPVASKNRQIYCSINNDKWKLLNNITIFFQSKFIIQYILYHNNYDKLLS